jgi:mRNA-degrading endonuclease RelE of RelBE toxin-antitoxin system
METPGTQGCGERLDHVTRERVLAALEQLVETGHGDVTKLRDVNPPEYRLRVGDWRVRYGLDPAARVLTVLRVLPRGEA